MASSITKSAYLNKALSYADLNYREGPDNSNKFSRMLGRDKEAWCVDFECGVAMELDPAKWTDLLPNTGSCLTAVAYWRNKGLWHQGFTGINSGDIGYLGMNGGTHTFIVVSLLGDRVSTVEGNTNDDGSANGDGVYRRTRSIQSIYGFGRPNYAIASSYYRPVKGDNWNKIADKFKTTVERLRELNGGQLSAVKTDRDVRVR